jgi:hypothetical protein
MVHNGLAVTSVDRAAPAHRVSAVIRRETGNPDVTNELKVGHASPEGPAVSVARDRAIDVQGCRPGLKGQAVTVVEGLNAVSDLAAVADQWISAAGPALDRTGAGDPECVMHSERVASPDIPGRADHVALDPIVSVVGRVLMAFPADGRATDPATDADPDAALGAVGASVHRAILQAMEVAASVGRLGWVPVAASADRATLVVPGLTAPGGVVLVALDLGLQILMVHVVSAGVVSAMVNVAVIREVLDAIAAPVQTVLATSAAAALVDLAALAVEWGAGLAATGAPVPVTDSRGRADLALTAAIVTTTGHRSTTISIAARNWLASMSQRGIVTNCW